MSDSESISSHDDYGDVIMKGIPRTYSYKISFDLYYDHTYVKEEAPEDAVDSDGYAGSEGGADADDGSEAGYYEGQAVQCRDPACMCDGEEAPLTAEEVDDFMREPYCGEKPRYYYYCTSILEALNMKIAKYNVRDVTYADGGKLQCVLDVILDSRTKRPSVDKLKHKISELDLYNSIYAGGPGNEAIVPTAHEYRYITMSSFQYEQTYNERGRIDFRGHLQIEIMP